MSCTVSYEIRDIDVRAHEFVVRMTLSGVREGAVRVTLPAWIPGSYMIRDFARNVTEFAASDEAARAMVVKHDKQTWEVACTGRTLQIDYRVYAYDLSVRSAFIDSDRAFFNGTSLFLRPECPVAQWELVIAYPTDQAVTADWEVFTTLPARDVDDRGFGRYEAVDYEQLIDHPVEFGEPAVGGFEVAGIGHRIVVSEGGDFDLVGLCRDLSCICAEHVAMFGFLPVSQYLFLALATADGYGGLEHRDSTSLLCRRLDLPAHGSAVQGKAYRDFLGLCSHEYFHLWNVKRIRPERLASADLSAEVHTHLLWAFEGITSYYDDLGVVRSGVIDPRHYLEGMAATVTRVQRGRGRLRQSIAESSFDAWTRFYKQDENAPNAIVSYYAKGALVAFGLDMTLRRESADRLCLDDLMRALWEEYGSRDIGVPEHGVEDCCAQLLGRSLDGFFAAYVHGTDELPLEDWFGAVGVGIRMRASRAGDDNGGLGSEQVLDVEPRRVLGARFEAAAGGLRLTHVLAAGAAERACLAPGDVLIAFGGEQVAESNWQQLLQRAQGREIEVHYFRRGRLAHTRVPLMSAPADTCELWLKPEAELDAATLARRGDWLRSRQPAA
jgi:predicted metalloprotease with PDZ domain